MSQVYLYHFFVTVFYEIIFTLRSLCSFLQYWF